MTEIFTMKSKSSAQSGNGRPLFNIKQYYTSGGSVHPQWMRSLEEKYQRIHSKIAQSTTAMSNLYRSTLGRTIIQEKPNIRTLSQSKDAPAVPRFQPNNMTVQKNPKAFRDPRYINRDKISATRISATVSQLKGLSTEKQPTAAPQNSLETHSVDNHSESCASQNDDNNQSPNEFEDEELDEDILPEELADIADADENVCNDGNNNIVDNIDIEQMETDSRIGSKTNNDNDDIGDNETKHIPVTAAGEKGQHVEHELATNALNSSFVETEANNDNIVSDKENKFEHTDRPIVNNKTPNRGGQFITQLGGHYHHSRLTRREKVPKTSTSRRSIQTQKTTKSCPAAMEARPTSMIQLSEHDRSKSAHRLQKKQGARNVNLFSRMSMEAQHAMTEAKNEVKPVIREFVVKPEVHENTQHKQTDSQEDRNVQIKHGQNQIHNIGLSSNSPLCDVENPAQRSTLLCQNSDYSEQRDIQNNHVNTNSNFNGIGVFNNRNKLPNIGENYYTLNTLQTQKYSLPGIGQYQFLQQKETTFEITPPGFDIRYKEARPLDERESETPPPDIKERAVQKCTEWLARYTPR